MRARRTRLTARLGQAIHSRRSLSGIEQLENRNLLTVAINNIQLDEDTGVSASDKITSNPTLEGTATTNLVQGGVGQVQFDHNGDGTPDGSATISNGTFSYNPLVTDSALQSYEGALTIKYRTRELDGYGGQIGVGDWQSFNLTLDRVKPTVSSISPVEVMQDAPDTQINLNNAFGDGVTPDNALTYQVVSTTNPNLYTSVSISSGTLTLNYNPDWFGNSEVVVRATDQAGNYKDTTINVAVIHPLIPPEITSFDIREVQPDVWELYGTIEDDTDMTGYYVVIYVVDTEDYLFAEIQSDGSFSTLFPSSNPGDWAMALCCDGDGLMSDEAWASFS